MELFAFVQITRCLNDTSIPTRYPLLRIDDCIDFQRKSKVLTALEAPLTYWPLAIKAMEKYETTTISHLVPCFCDCLVFGSQNAPATFQRAFDIIFSEVR